MRSARAAPSSAVRSAREFSAPCSPSTGYGIPAARPVAPGPSAPAPTWSAGSPSGTSPAISGTTTAASTPPAAISNSTVGSMFAVV